MIWLRALNSWHEVNKDLLAERTYRGAGDAPLHLYDSGKRGLVARFGMTVLPCHS